MSDTYWTLKCAVQDIGRVTRILGEPDEVMEQIDAAGVTALTFSNVNIAVENFFLQCDEGVPFVLLEEETDTEYPGDYLFIRRIDGVVKSRMQDGDGNHLCLVRSDGGLASIDKADYLHLCAFVSDEHIVRQQIIERGVAWLAEQQAKKDGGGGECCLC